MKKILIRTDASKKIGLGHITRCLSLAKKFRNNGNKVYFAIRNFNIAKHKIKENNFEMFILKNENYDKWLQSIVIKKNIDIFIGDVRDGLSIKTIKKLKKKNVLTIAIDEPSEYAKECDICFYPPHAKIDISQYKGKVYQGFEYVILRDEFYKTYKKPKNKTPKLLIMMGGSDKYNLTLPILEKIIFNNFDVSVIIDKTHKDYEQIKKLNVKIYSNINNMAKFLSKIDFAIVSFGMSAYELLAMKIPAIHICLDKDHYQASKWFEKNEYAFRYKKENIEKIEIQNIYNKLIKIKKINNNIFDIISNYNLYFISIGAGYSQLPLIQEIKRKGYKVISFDLNPKSVGRKFSDIFYNISTYDSTKIIKNLTKINLKIVGVLSRATGEPVLTASKIAQYFNLRALDVKNAKLFINKASFMKVLNKLNIPSPKTIVVKNNIKNLNINFPVFVKPSKTVFSHAAMNLCKNRKYLKKAIKKAIKISESKEVNIEEYLQGRDIVSIDFIFNGEIIHIINIGEVSKGKPDFYGLGWYSVGNQFDNITQKVVFTMVKKLKIKNGFLQTAMKIDKKQAKIYEVHAEIGGDRVNDKFIPYVLKGYNIFEENINLAVNRKPNKVPKERKFIIMLFKKIKNYKKIDDIYIKEFKSLKALEKELKSLEKKFIFSTNYENKK